VPRYTLNQLMRLPWTFVGPKEFEGHFELRIAELPDFFLAGETKAEVLEDLRGALETFLQSFIAEGEEPPLPAHIDWWRIVLAYSAAKPAEPDDPAVVAAQPDARTAAETSGELVLT
jgi:predicted RNase H-like HicB family nuclease